MPVVSGRCVSAEGGVCTTQAGRWMDGWMMDARRWMQGRAGQDAGMKWKK